MPMHLIYIAASYRGPDLVAITCNIANARAIAVQVAVQVAVQGWSPVCPHLKTDHMEEHVDHPDDFWLAGTILLMEKCAAVILVPGWQSSTGTLAEVAHAKQLRIPVFTNHEFLPDADEFRAPEPHTLLAEQA